MAAPAPTLLLVYGTLRPGEPAHGLLVAARPHGPARTEPCFELLHLEAYPGLARGGSTSVVGELYEVDEDTLLELDAYEGVPELYRRERVRLDDGREVVAYVLVHAPPDAVRIASGDWRRR